MAPAVRAPSSSSTSVSTTVAPSDANSRPSSAPWPRAPPVITATFPSSRPIAFSSFEFGKKIRLSASHPHHRRLSFAHRPTEAAMKNIISICGSMQLFEEMQLLQADLRRQGFDVFLPEAEE